jgi:hypothetical protein
MTLERTASEPNPLYPDLLAKIYTPQFGKGANFLSLFGGRGWVEGMIAEAKEVAITGKLTTEFHLDEEYGGRGSYIVRMNIEEAGLFVTSLEQFFTQPLKHINWASAMTPELESLVCGGKPERYTKLSISEES